MKSRPSIARGSAADGLHKRRGIWYFYYRDPVLQKSRERSAGTSDYAEAKDKRADFLRDLRDGSIVVGKGKLKLSAAIDEWFEDAKLRLQPSTLATRRWHLKAIRELFGHLRLEQIGVDQLRAFQRTRSRVCANVTVNTEISRLRTVLEHFEQWTPDLKKRYKHLPCAPSSVGRALTDAEEAKCWEVAQRSPQFMLTYNISIFLGNTGLRRSEFLKVRIEQLDLDNREVWVRKLPKGGRNSSEQAKTDAARRVVPLNEHAAMAAAMLLERARAHGSCQPEHYLLPAYMHRRRTRCSSDGCVTFSSATLRKSTGGIYDPSQHQKSFRTAWRHFTRECGIADLRIHDRRHHFVTLCAEADVPIETTMSMVGHMSPEMVRHYTHIRDRKKRAAVASIEAANVITPEQLAAGRKPASAAQKVLQFPKEASSGR